MAKVWLAASRCQRASGKSSLENKGVIDIHADISNNFYLKVRKSKHHCRVLQRTEGAWLEMDTASDRAQQSDTYWADTSLTTTNSTSTLNNFLSLWENIKDSSVKGLINVRCFLWVAVLLPVISSVSPNPSCLISLGLNHRSCCLGEISPHCYTQNPPPLLFYICICLSQH